MLLNEREEQNIIKSFARDMQKPSYPKEKLRSEILSFLRREVSEINAMLLEAMLQEVNQASANNQNEMLRVVSYQ